MDGELIKQRQCVTVITDAGRRPCQEYWTDLPWTQDKLRASERTVMLLSNPSCRRCGGAMQEVADIAPNEGAPGLRAFICNDCGTADSILIHSGTRFGTQKGQFETGDHAAREASR